jgi:hypothetical protein
MKKGYLALILLVFLFSCEKLNDNSDLIIKFYGDAYEDIGYSIAQIESGYVIAGMFTEITRGQGSSGSYISGSVKKMAVIKTGKDGNVVWKKMLGGKLPASGSKVIVLNDGTYAVTGYAVDSVYQKDIYVVRLDAEGNTMQEKIYNSPGNQYGTDIIKTQEGFLILGVTDVKRDPVTDYTGNAAGKDDILILRVNNNLEPLISPVAVGYIGNDEGASVKQDNNGGYIVVGTTDRSDRVLSVQAGKNIFLIRINADGSTTQPRIIGGTDDEYASDIEVLNNGYLIAGTVGAEGTVQKGYVWKMTSNIYAEPESEHSIDVEPGSTSKSTFSVKSICNYKTNSFVMAGQIGTGSTGRILIFATDADGNLIDGKVKVEGGTGTQIAYDVISENDGTIIAVGKNSYENNSMISLLKFKF